jgi:hypothetical protein
MTSVQAVLILASYVDHIATTPWNKEGALRKSDTVAKFVTAACFFFENMLPSQFSIYTTCGGKPVMVPKIAQRLSFYKKWDLVKEKREPYTREMFATFQQQVADLERMHPSTGFLTRHSLIFDTQILGIFTGSRVSEYAQSKGSRTKVSRVPIRPGTTPSGKPLPIAFAAGDFEFLSADSHTIPHELLFDNPSRAVQVNITFRFDKSGRNYTVRKFGRGTDWLCPITAAYRILLRAHLLDIPPTDPVCAYRAQRTTGHKWLTCTEVTSTMRQICLDTYPDKQHYLHRHVKNFASHSNRVTAAVALSQSGMSIDAIAQRLRWKPESVAFYLRESAKDIGFYTANTIAGAQRPFVVTP